MKLWKGSKIEEVKNKIRNKKAIILIICFIISLLINTMSIATADIGITGIANEETGGEETGGDTGGGTTAETPYRHLELRATQIKEIEGKNRQLIMELWGNDIEFKRI